MPERCDWQHKERSLVPTWARCCRDSSDLHPSRDAQLKFKNYLSLLHCFDARSSEEVVAARFDDTYIRISEPVRIFDVRVDLAAQVSTKSDNVLEAPLVPGGVWLLQPLAPHRYIDRFRFFWTLQ